MTDALSDMPTCIAGQNLMKKIRYGQHITKTDLDFDRLSKGFKKTETNIKIVDANNTLQAVVTYEQNRDKFAYACVFQT